MKIYLRTFLKGTIWELLGIIIAFVIFHEWKTIGIYFLVRILIYYPYHRIFKKIKFKKVLDLKYK